MSRTEKKTKTWNKGTKMRPYTKNPGDLKEKASKTDHVGGYSKGVSAYDKLIARNVNRSKKKAYRQQLKKELKDEQQNVY